MDDRLRRALRHADPEDLIEALKSKGYIETVKHIAINPAGTTIESDVWQCGCTWQVRTALVRPWLPGHCGKKGCKCVRAINAVSWRRDGHKFSKKENEEYALERYRKLLKHA